METERQAFCGRYCLLFVIVCLISILNGCGSKQPSQVDSGLHTYLVPDEKTTPLATNEKNILEQPTGKIINAIPPAAQSDVEKQYKYFLRRGRKTMDIFSQRAEKYLSYVKETFRHHGLPEELAYLAVVESGYNPTAHSRVGAAGAWQFMPYTGMKYGLNQNKWLDERLDIFKSTESAAVYLQKLYSQFGDWPTAIAAYNSGEGKMSRACAAANEQTFFAVCKKNDQLDEKTKLKEETRQYVPKFIAVTKIMENLDKLGFRPINPENFTSPAKVLVRPGTDLKAMANACKMSWNEFSEYNPHQLQTVSSTETATNVYVPGGQRELALAFVRRPVMAPATAFAQKGTSSLPRFKKEEQLPLRYQLANGESLYSVAKRHGTTVDAILSANGFSSARQVRSGANIRIPVKRPSGMADDSREKGLRTTKAASNVVVADASDSLGRGQKSYQVHANDNLWQISRKLNVSVDDLCRWNNINGSNIQAGQTLVVYSK